MPAPRSIDAYKDCEDFFNRALGSEKGIGISTGSNGEATHLAQKLNTYRNRLRKDSRKIYPSDDPRAGATAFDKFQIKIDPENPARVLIKLNEITALSVDNL